MGQIKNIKLHIVTDIKTTRSSTTTTSATTTNKSTTECFEFHQKKAHRRRKKQNGGEQNNMHINKHLCSLVLCLHSKSCRTSLTMCHPRGQFLWYNVTS